MSDFFKDYPIRYIAQMFIEADTPLNISSGETGILTDSLIMTDVNGLPMILGTSLAGVLRHSLSEKIKEDILNSIFGYQSPKGKEGKGSRLIISNAHFMGKDGEVIEGLQEITWTDETGTDEFYQKFLELPIRQHAKITHRGVADTDKHGKFDEQVVYKGTRFKFEIELIGNREDSTNWDNLLSLLNDETFRIGGGTRKGFGKLKVVSLKTKTYNLKDDLEKYAEKSSSLNGELTSIDEKDKYMNKSNDNWTKYELNLTPEDFWMFGSGFGDEDVDMVPVYEEIIKWNGNTPTFSKKKILIPATSVKGAISHRVAFHYNKLTDKFADNLSKEEMENLVGNNNSAVQALFGYTKKNKDQETVRGNVIFSDVFLEKKQEETKILNHVAIDRFTGGAIDGALFDEKVIAQKDEIALEILVNKKSWEKEKVEPAFEQTLKDICTGMLPLGGGVMRGHGVFNGKIKKDGKDITDEIG